MLWLKNNFGRIYCNTGEEQPPCPRIEHTLYIMKWNQTNKYNFFPASGNLRKPLSTKDGKGTPKELCSNFGPIEAIETSAACSFNSYKSIMRPCFMKVTMLKKKKSKKVSLRPNSIIVT